MTVCHLYSAVKNGIEPIGPLNDLVITNQLRYASVVILAWGADPEALLDWAVIERTARISLWCKRRHEHVYQFGGGGHPLGVDISASLSPAMVPGEDDVADLEDIETLGNQNERRTEDGHDSLE